MEGEGGEEKEGGKGKRIGERSGRKWSPSSCRTCLRSWRAGRGQTTTGGNQEAAAKWGDNGKNEGDKGASRLLGAAKLDGWLTVCGGKSISVC